MSVKERKKLGIGYIPSDRHKNAMIADFSIAENFLLGYQDKPQYNSHVGFINYANLRKDAQEQVDRFETKLAGLDQPIGQLSGGNQQKIILGRETSHDPSFMLVHSRERSGYRSYREGAPYIAGSSKNRGKPSCSYLRNSRIS